MGLSVEIQLETALDQVKCSVPVYDHRIMQRIEGGEGHRVHRTIHIGEGIRRMGGGHSGFAIGQPAGDRHQGQIIIGGGKGSVVHADAVAGDAHVIYRIAVRIGDEGVVFRNLLRAGEDVLRGFVPLVDAQRSQIAQRSQHRIAARSR